VAYHVQEPNIIPSPGWTPARKTMRPNHRKIRAPGPRQHHRRGRQSHRRNIYQDSLAAKFFRLFVKSHGSDPSQESCKPYQTPAAETSTSRNSSASCKPHTRTRCRQTSIPLRIMWNLGYACADSSNEQRPDNDNNPAGSICRRRRFRMCCACGDHHAAWDCASTRESRVPVNKLWAWPCAPPTGWDTMKQQKLKYWLSRMCHDTMRRPLYGDEMPLPTPDYFLDGNNSAGDSPQLPPERFAEPHGTPGFVRNLAAKTSNHSRPLVSRSASHTSTLYQRPPSPSGNHQTSPRGPRTAGSLRGGCRPTQMTTTPAIRTFRARQLHSAQPFQGSQTFQQTPSQLLLGQNST
jgi:hypothetical protein